MQPITDSQLADLNEAAQRYAASMTEEAARYLVHQRGLTPETGRTHLVGVVADPLAQHQRYEGWLAIPYIVKNDVVQIRFRCIKDHDHREFSHGKYGQPSGEPLRVYNVNAIHNSGDTIHVTEGEFDAMILNQLGLPAVAFPGASSFKGYHGRMLAGFNRIWVWGDGDQAGAEFAQTVVNRLPRSAKTVRVPIGMDVTDIYRAGGAQQIYNLVQTDK
jgi:DNA primase